MATHIAGPDGQLEQISNIASVGTLDLSDPRTMRQQGTLGDVAHDFIGGAPVVTVVPAQVEWAIIFTHTNSTPYTMWKYATEALRDAAYLVVTTALTV